mgnify:CR=1 FL=1
MENKYVKDNRGDESLSQRPLKEGFDMAAESMTRYSNMRQRSLLDSHCR